MIYLSQIANEKKKFNFNEVVKNITEKMILRHSHLFNKKKFKSMNEFRNWWKKSKNKKYKSILDDIPITYHAMLRSRKIQKKVANVGFDYSSDIEAINKIMEEVNELKNKIKNNNKRKIKEMLGDLFFACLDISRKLNLNPEIVLLKSNQKFIQRRKLVEKHALSFNKNIKNIGINLLKQLWVNSKN